MTPTKFTAMDTFHTSEPFLYRLHSDKSVTRTIRVKPDSDGNHFLLEVIDTSLTGPELSWTRYDSSVDATVAAKHTYEESLHQGFVPTT